MSRSAVLAAFLAALPSAALDFSLDSVLPPVGHTMLLVGQDSANIFAYTKAMGVPAGLSSYFGVGSASIGITQASDWGAGTNDADGLLRKYGNGIVFNLACDMAKQAGEIAAGSFDDNVQAFADWMKSTEVPILFRPGYEFDGEWNRNDPGDFVGAYRRFVDLFRDRGATNVFFVWHTAAMKRYRDHSWDEWYPGDEYVDVFGMSVFSQVYQEGNPHKPGTEAGDYGVASTLDDFASMAQSHGKPLMICESTPKGYRVGEDGLAAWDSFYQPLLDVVERLDVRVLAYISDDWDAQPMWRDHAMRWGDSRPWTHPEVRERWEKEMSKPRWAPYIPDAAPQTYDPDRLDAGRAAAFLDAQTKLHV